MFEYPQTKICPRGGMFQYLHTVYYYLIFLIGQFSLILIIAYSRAITEYERLWNTKQSHYSGDDFSKAVRPVTVLNTRSLNNHRVHIGSDNRLTTSDFLCLTQTQIEDFFLKQKFPTSIIRVFIAFDNFHQKYRSITYGIKKN